MTAAYTRVTNFIRSLLRYSPGVRQKVVLVLLCVLVTSLGTSSWLNIKQHESDILRETNRHGNELVRIVSEALTYSVVGYDYHTIKLLLDQIASSEEVAYVKVLSSKGNVMAETGDAAGQNVTWTPFARDIMFENKPVGRLIIGFDNQGVIQQLQAQKSSLITREALIIILIAVGEFLALSYIIVRPVTIITRSLDESIDDSGQISQPIPLFGRDEFGQLALQFNTMRLRLNEANARMQSRVALADANLTQSNLKLQKQAEELQHINKELQLMATTDSLTGLYNRRYFDNLVATELEIIKRHGDYNSILMIDIDNFKEVNDAYGHGAGDRVLVQIADILTTTLRKSDLLCRIGGEEFIVLCRRADVKESMHVAEKIRRNVEAHLFVVADTDLHVTVSIGVALLHGDTNVDAVDTFVQQADLALYQSKSQGRNRVTHYDSLKSNASEKGKVS